MVQVKVVSIAFEAETAEEYQRIMKWTIDQRLTLADFFGFPRTTRVVLTCKQKVA